MSKANYINRFCFSYSTKEFEKLGFSLNIEKHINTELPISGLVSLELYKNEETVFLILDITYNFNLTDLNISLNKYKSTNQVAKLISDTINLITAVQLRRIFQKAPLKDPLSKKIRNSKRIVMTLGLVNNENKRNEYIKLHKYDSIWPQILKNMNTIGIKDMEIYLHEYQAYLIMDTSPHFDMEKDGEKWAKLPQEKEWQNYVSQFQKVNPKSKAVEKWFPMTLINNIMYEK
ncbi:L-rhamnose mutarotase [Snuella sedimenti]|uniref:L-rhamnose mutarotase n=1 Tax=Snuella sedimenti TaxID=2798802 RepID=A0A8J7LUB6_9FLAO|nr:L-rhamnose mutarotase [Snuella sedimenti]MBJ6369570.1 L-rhamnose mutarotase [Snuella sedimenti]